ncbi:hypothetical protein [Synechococcus phage S-8S29]|nr:hypothetical protein [Synechococcus phage S-8S29]
MIKKIKETLGQIFHSPEATGTWEVTESPILGEDTTNYDEWIEEEKPYIGIPAPAYLEDDPWFPAPVLSEKQMSYKEAHEQAVAEQQILDESETKESADIHQKLYEAASKNWTTVLESQGGSENFQEGPGGWMSGTGYGQFTR